MELAATSPSRLKALHRYTPVSSLVTLSMVNKDSLTSMRPSRLHVTSGLGTPLTEQSIDTFVPLSTESV